MLSRSSSRQGWPDCESRARATRSTVSRLDVSGAVDRDRLSSESRGVHLGFEVDWRSLSNESRSVLFDICLCTLVPGVFHLNGHFATEDLPGANGNRRWFSSPCPSIDALSRISHRSKGKHPAHAWTHANLRARLGAGHWWSCCDASQLKLHISRQVTDRGRFVFVWTCSLARARRGFRCKGRYQRVCARWLGTCFVDRRAGPGPSPWMRINPCGALRGTALRCRAVSSSPSCAHFDRCCTFISFASKRLSSRR